MKKKGHITDHVPAKTARHSFCCRCEMPTENSPIAHGWVPTGQSGKLEEVKNVVLCVDCRTQMETDANLFWNSDWPYNKNKKG